MPQPALPSRVVLGVSGGIAAYKACEVLRRLTESGHDVRVVPTRGALQFVGAATWAALSGQPVTTDVWDDVEDVPHVRLGQEADLVLVVPATADLMARAAIGRADDLLTATLLTARCPVVMAPAMHTEMWEHPATQANVATLRSRGVVVLEPAVGRLTGADSGSGPPARAGGDPRRGPPRARPRGRCVPDLAGRHVVVSAGGTREPLDPVRFLGNRSSGRQGWALAAYGRCPRSRGHPGRRQRRLRGPRRRQGRAASAAPRSSASPCSRLRPGADAVVMAAAVADFRPARSPPPRSRRPRREPGRSTLVRTADVLRELVDARDPGPGRRRVRRRDR